RLERQEAVVPGRRARPAPRKRPPCDAIRMGTYPGCASWRSIRPSRGRARAKLGRIAPREPIALFDIVKTKPSSPHDGLRLIGQPRGAPPQRAMSKPTVIRARKVSSPAEIGTGAAAAARTIGTGVDDPVSSVIHCTGPSRTPAALA